MSAPIRIGAGLGPALAVLLSAVGAAGQAVDDGAAREVARHVLILTDTARDDAAKGELDAGRDFLQLPLEHLGMVCRVHDLRHGEPADLDPLVTRGVIVALHGQEAAPAWTWPWLVRQRARGIGRFVHFDGVEPLLGDDPGPLREWLQGFGLAWEQGHLTDPLRVAVRFRSEAECCHEGPPVRREHLGPRSEDPRNVVWTTTIDRDRPADVRHPVVTGPWGGLLLTPYALTMGTGVGDRRWHVDPFVFLREALGLRSVPAPDPCVEQGRRRFLLHVDGDGFESVSVARPGQESCGVVFRDEVIRRFRLPMTISIIVAGLTDDLAGEVVTERMAEARTIFALPWVEAASHAVLHPMDWRRQLHPRSPPRSVVWYPGIANYRHDMPGEVRESVRFIERRLLPAGGRCAVMLWSGMANPDAATLRACAELGIWNVNGGVYRWDRQQASVGYVAPWSREVDGQLQVHCGAANENVFDGFYDDLPGAFRHVDQTIENTGRGRILKPANVYAHFYSAENPGRLRALLWLIEKWAVQAETIAVPASAWARAVVAARRCRITEVEDGFALLGFAGCRTLRLDDEPRDVDWARSTGVVGARRLQGSLYVQLAGDTATLRLGSGARPWPHVEQASVVLDDVAIDQGGVRFGWRSFAAGSVVLAGFPPGAKLVRTLDGVDADVVGDGDGRLTLPLAEGEHRLEVRVR